MAGTQTAALAGPACSRGGRSTADGHSATVTGSPISPHHREAVVCLQVGGSPTGGSPTNVTAEYAAPLPRWTVAGSVTRQRVLLSIGEQRGRSDSPRRACLAAIFNSDCALTSPLRRHSVWDPLVPYCRQGRDGDRAAVLQGMLSARSDETEDDESPDTEEVNLGACALRSPRRRSPELAKLVASVAFENGRSVRFAPKHISCLATRTRQAQPHRI